MMHAMDDQQELLVRVVSELRTVSSPARAIVFGSVAAGSVTADGDLDLLVLQLTQAARAIQQGRRGDE